MSIDADDLIKAFEALDLMNGQYAESFTNMAGNRSMEIESAINSKTIDAKPIVHAHWIEQEHEIFKCSNCGNYHGRGTKIIHEYVTGGTDNANRRI